MKKVLLIVFVVLVVFAAINRNRIFVRDPFGKVTRNGVKEDGAQVYINFANHVLLMNENAPVYVEILIPGAPVGGPKHLTCVHWMACMTEADHPELLRENPGSYIESMNETTVKFMDSGAKQTVVTLR